MTQADRIAASLAGGMMSVHDIAALTNLPTDTVRVLLNRHKGRFILVERLGKEGMWGLTTVSQETVT